MDTILGRGIAELRDQFDGEDNNRFTFALGQAARYERFVRVIFHRNVESSTAHLDASQKMTELAQQLPSGQPDIRVTELLNVLTATSEAVHLDIESYYLFSKILLDHLARFVHGAFPQVRNVSMDSHDDLVKNIKKYENGIGLVIPPLLLEKAEDLKRRIADFRDYQIAHAKFPRRSHATVRDATGLPRMAFVTLYPKANEQIDFPESEAVDLLHDGLKTYLEHFMDFFRANISRSKYRIKTGSHLAATAQ